MEKKKDNFYSFIHSSSCLFYLELSVSSVFVVGHIFSTATSTYSTCTHMSHVGGDDPLL